jgi:hypothetical protein
MTGPGEHEDQVGRVAAGYPLAQRRLAGQHVDQVLHVRPAQVLGALVDGAGRLRRDRVEDRQHRCNACVDGSDPGHDGPDLVANVP